jgi:predicted transcriptional regulator
VPASRSFDYEDWFVREVKQALKEAEAGEVVDHEAVLEKWEHKRIAKSDRER